MDLRKHIKKVIIGACLILIGTVIIFPVEAHIVGGKDAHTLAGRHGIYFSPRTWIKRYFYTKRQSNTRYYTKTQSNSRYYTKSFVDTLLGGYLTSSNAATTYLPLSGGTLAGSLTGNSITGTTITSTSFAYSMAKTKYLTIPANKFIPRTGTTLTYLEAGNAYYYGGVGSTYPMAGIDLPNGAIITRLSLYTKDNSNSSITLYLYRRSLLVDGGDTLASVASDGVSGSPDFLNSTTTISNGTVDNDNYYYYMMVDMTNSDATLYLRAARITYTLTNLDN